MGKLREVLEVKLLYYAITLDTALDTDPQWGCHKGGVDLQNPLHYKFALQNTHSEWTGIDEIRTY